MFFARRSAAFGFALAPVHLRDFAAQRETQDDPQKHDDRQYDHALEVRIADRPDYVGRHQELKAEHERLFKREAQMQPFVFRGAAAREREAQAARTAAATPQSMMTMLMNSIAAQAYSAKRWSVCGAELRTSMTALFRQQAADEDEIFGRFALRHPFYGRGEKFLRRLADVAAEAPLSSSA